MFKISSQISSQVLYQILAKILLCLVFSMVMLGCKNQLKPGHYEGNLYWRNYSDAADQPVGIDISYDRPPGASSEKEGQINITDQNGNIFTSLTVSHFSKHKFDLNIPAIYPTPIRLKRSQSNSPDKATVCYAGQSDWTVELCYDDRRLYLKVVDQDGRGVFKLMGDVFAKESKFVLEPAVELSLDQAVQKALGTNLDARIGFEKVIQAKYAVTAAYLNLIPHLTTNLIWNAEPGYVSAIATLQGLVPFLLPTYWLQAKESEFDLKIKKDAETILKADLAAMVEQLSYAYDRDREIVQIHERTILSLKSFINHVSELEALGQVPTGSAVSLSPIVEKVNSNRGLTLQLLKEDQYTISQALGFHNPEAVTRVSVPSFAPNSPVKTIEKSELADLGSRRSFEVRQVDYLKKIAQLKKLELYFTWIDPSGDPKSGFGFNTIAQVKISKSQIRELDLRREQLKQTIYQNVYRIVDRHNSMIEFVNQMISRVSVSNQDLDAILKESLREGFRFETITALVEQFLSNEIGIVANLTAYRISRSKIDRIILSGYYEYLLPVLDRDETESGLQLP